MEASEKCLDSDWNCSNSATNDPWSPAPSAEPRIPLIAAVPQDPLRNMISSEKYIESLEKKLSKVNNKQKRAVTAEDMLQSLMKAKEDQMTQFLSGGESVSSMDLDYSNSDSNSAFSFQRLINPEKQAINPVELVPLVQNDVLAKTAEEVGTTETESDVEEVNVKCKEAETEANR